MKDLFFTWETGTAAGAMIRCLKQNRIPYNRDHFFQLCAPIGPGYAWTPIDYKHVSGNTFRIIQKGA